MAQCAVKLRHVPHLSTAAGRGGHKTSTRGFHANPGSLFLQDLSDTVVQLTGCVIKMQEKDFNNPLATLVINNRPGVKAFGGDLRTYKGGPTPAGQLVWKTSATFSDASRMKDAARDAFILLKSLTRKSSGIAVRNYHFYLGKVGQDTPGRYLGQSSAGFLAIPQDELTFESTISIIGPLVPYGRKLYWNPKGGKTVLKRFDTKKIKKILGLKGKFQGGFIGTETMHTDVKKRMRRKAQYKSMSFSDPFYQVPRKRIEGYASNYGDTMKRPLRMPAITIQMKSRGRVN